MNLERLKEINMGMKFSTEGKIIKFFEFKETRNISQIERNKKEIQRYLEYEKTGKIVNGKITNEIIITKIYDTPLDKVDGRVNNGAELGSGLYQQPLIELCYTLQSGVYTTSEIMKYFGLINDKEIVSTYVKDMDKGVKSYLNKFKIEFRRKLYSSLDTAIKLNGNKLSYDNTFLLKNNEEDKYEDFVLATIEESKTIRNIEEKTKKYLEDKYNKKWNSLMYREDTFEEYKNKSLNSIQMSLGICGYFPVINYRNILDNKFIYEFVCIKKENEETIKVLFEELMYKFIENYKYDANRKHRIKRLEGVGKKHMGKRTSMFDAEYWIYPLKDNEKVNEIHYAIFNAKKYMLDNQLEEMDIYTEDLDKLSYEDRIKLKFLEK